MKTWKGKAVEDLSRDELLEVIDYLGKQLQGLHSPEAIHDRIVGQVERFIGAA